MQVATIILFHPSRVSNREYSLRLVWPKQKSLRLNHTAQFQTQVPYSTGIALVRIIAGAP